jgi:chromosome segregation ATPase
MLGSPGNLTSSRPRVQMERWLESRARISRRLRAELLEYERLSSPCDSRGLRGDVPILRHGAEARLKQIEGELRAVEDLLEHTAPAREALTRQLQQAGDEAATANEEMTRLLRLLHPHAGRARALADAAQRLPSPVAQVAVTVTEESQVKACGSAAGGS